MTPNDNGQTLLSESQVADNLQQVNARIARACIAAERSQDDVTLLAVSKTKPLHLVMAAYAHGQRHFGENYLQDALSKIEHCQAPDITWHFIGTIQSNKTKDIAEHFAWAHTLERMKIAQRLNDQRPSHLPPLKVCIQVNISQENNKSGIYLSEVDALADAIADLPNLQLMGLMCIPKANQTSAVQAQAFRAMVAASHAMRRDHPAATVLSMGMSNDLELAIAEGTSMVRIGTDIFGSRATATHTSIS